MKITIVYPPATTPHRTVRKWGAAGMVADTYSATVRTINGQPVGQFGLVQVYQLVNGVYIGDMSANTTFCNISHSEMLAIADLQTADEYSVDTKMNWLTNGGSGAWGCPMSCTGDWQTATDGKLIGAVYAGQPLEVLEQRTFTNVRWNGKIEAEVPMSRIKPGTLQKVTVVDQADRYGEKPKGIVWLPLKFRGEAWIFDRWLV